MNEDRFTTFAQNITWPLLAFGIVLLAFVSLPAKQKHGILRRFFSRGRATTAFEPLPQSSPPSKVQSKPLASSLMDIAATFPPTQRDQLRTLVADLPQAQQAAFGDLQFDQVRFEKSLLGFDEEYTTADPDKYVFSGLSIGEIRALGDFPDYAALTEVPLPQPYINFDIDTALARPYRPFRWAYHQTMSLTKLEPDWWIELEKTYKDRIEQRKTLYKQYGGEVLQWLPGSRLACKELMEMSIQFLCARYPQYFTLSDDKRILENKILHTTSKLDEDHPLIVMLDNIPEDFAIMLRNPETGYYHFRAGMICSALGWNVATKIGLQLHEIHEPVPDYKEKMQYSMDRFFTKMHATKPIQRASWGLEVDEPLYMPPGDPHAAYRERQEPSLTRERINLRVDWQTLRRMPLSGAIVFNFKALFTPLYEFSDEPYIPSLLLKLCNEAKENLMQYKNTWHVEHIAKPALEEYEREQIAKGIIEEDWEVKTLEQSPYFPGWEAKWHRQQGF